MHVTYHEGTERYVISSTTGRDGTFFADGTGRYIYLCFHDGTGRYAYSFTAQESAMQNALLSTLRPQCYKLKLFIVSYHLTV